MVVMMMSLSVAGLLIMKNIKAKSLAGRKSWIVPILLFVSSCLLLCDMAAGRGMAFRMPLDLMLSLLALSSVASSVLPDKAAFIVSVLVCAAESGLAVYYLLCAFFVTDIPPDGIMICSAALVAVCMAGIFMCGVLYRLSDMRTVMSSCNALSGISLMADVAYLFAFLSWTIMMLWFFGFHGDAGLASCVFVLFLGAGQAAYGLREYSGTAFLILRKLETRVAGAVKASKMELDAMRPKPDDSYREVYSRVLLYFEEEKPYLNGELTINDVVKEVYTNKLYISRAISQYAGKNFCQFVNWHRVKYSVESYRMNPEMTVTDLWQNCGFNSVVSYNMAFKLFMGENPGEWCRKEKARLARIKK